MAAPKGRPEAAAAALSNFKSSCDKLQRSSCDRPAGNFWKLRNWKILEIAAAKKELAVNASSYQLWNQPST